MTHFDDGKLYCIIGKSCSGKDSIVRELVSRYRGVSTPLTAVVTYTTRPMRDGEKDGEQYYFCSDSFIEQMDQLGRVIESRTYDTVHGQWTYATIDDGQLKFNESNFIVPCTLQQFVSLKVYLGEDRVEGIYLQVSDKELLRRAFKRNSDKLETIRRFIADKFDFRKENLRNAKIDNYVNNEHSFNVAVMDCISYIQNWKY